MGNVNDRLRLDLALVERGLTSSRQRAKQAVQRGDVVVDGTVVSKPSAEVRTNAVIELIHDERYVARSAHKLLGAFDVFPDLDVRGRDAFDAGASTGGFTQVLLERGARHVVAVDVGHDQLAESLRSHPRVTNCEGVNLRDFTASEVLPSGMTIDVVVGDLSFISLTLVLPRLVDQLGVQDRVQDYVLLIKPQFEVGRGNLSHGIVTDESATLAAVDNVKACAMKLGLTVRGIVPAAIAGTHGNQEYVMWATHSHTGPSAEV